jgi:hypothetical protein
MVSRFAHFSILEGDIKETIRFLKRIPKIPNADISVKMFNQIKKENLARDNIDKARTESLFNQLVGYLSDSSYYVGKNNRWVTVCSGNFGVESIWSFASSISRKSPKLFMAIGNFDNEVFLFDLIVKGEILVEKVIDPNRTLPKYNCGNTRKVAELLEIPEKIDRLEDIFKITDMLEKFQELEKLLNMKLWYNRMDELPDDWEKVVIKN